MGIALSVHTLFAAIWVGGMFFAYVCLRPTLAGIDATVPTFAAPRESMVLTVHGNPPMGWLVPFFPAELAFVALGGGFVPDALLATALRAVGRKEQQARWWRWGGMAASVLVAFVVVWAALLADNVVHS
eukprot:gene56728-77755_t